MSRLRPRMIEDMTVRRKSFASDATILHRRSFET